MAGGKASPRQKMINMMYLVLTALLAMNVSAEVLESFQQLADSLRVSADKFSEKNHQLAGDIVNTIKSDPSYRNSLYLIPMTNQVTTTTDSIINIIDQMRDELYKEEIGGGRVEGLEFHILNKSETEKNLRFWMISDAGDEYSNEGQGSGNAKVLHAALDGYVKYANKLYSEQMTVRDSASGRTSPGPLDHFATLAPSPKDYYPDNADFAEQRSKTWEQFNFTHNPIVANLAVLEKLKNDVNVIEAELLAVLRSKINNIVFKIDSLVPVDAPEAQVVVAGMKFRTKLYVSVSSTQMKPSFGPGVKVLPGGQMGEMEIAANASVIPQGKNEGEQSYSTVIRVPKANGEMMNLTVKGKFKVRRPELVVTSRSVQILYKDCANNLNVDCPALGDLYNPKFQARGGTAEGHPTDKKLVRVVPAGGALQLLVSTVTNGQTVELGRLDYRVIEPPKPILMFSKDGRSQMNNGENLRMGASLKFKVVPDKDFAAGLPNDARYVVNSVAIFLKNGIGAPQPMGSIQLNSAGGDIPLAAKTSGAPPGSQVILVVDEVRRVNFQNRQIKENFGERDRTISVTLTNN